MSAGKARWGAELQKSPTHNSTCFLRDLRVDTHMLMAGFPHSSTRTTSWSPTANFVLSMGWQ
jgi:hypothetical protein